ncbi:DegV family protein [Candidatus Formimonas warabiya]|uniref:DegV family protein n=1 Tax=Formimonas warabiya TaxID=1761012 RepID=UPI001BE3F324|nr:DegV family protein [Candidatus Formimonas warabiya]
MTDSTAYLGQDLMERYHISEVSLTVNFYGRSFPEGKERKYHDFYERLRHSKLFPTTSQPAVGDFVETYRRLTADGSSVISLHISGRFSGTAQAAHTAADMLEDKDICVVDSLYTVAVLGYMVEEAGKMAAEGKSKNDILARINFMRDHSHLFFLVDSLDYLYRGGRIGGAAALFGTILQIKPILYVKDGVIDVLTKVRTREKAVQQLMQEVAGQIQNMHVPRIRMGVLHVDDPAKGENLGFLLEQRFPGIKPDQFEVGPVVGSHVGPGSVGVAISEVN